MFDLDGGGGVGQPSGAPGLQPGSQRGLPHQGKAAPAVAVAEVLVFHSQQLPAPGDEVAASGQIHGIAAGGPVEGLGGRGPPVDGDGLLVVVPHRHPAHIEPVATPFLGPVEAAEHQRGVADIGGR